MLSLKFSTYIYGVIPAKTNIVFALSLVCFLMILSKALVYMFFNLLLILQLLYVYNSFFKSSMFGNALRNSSGISSKVLYVATPIGLL